MENQQVKVKAQNAPRKSEVSKAELTNLAGFLDVLIQIDLEQKRTLSEGK